MRYGLALLVMMNAFAANAEVPCEKRVAAMTAKLDKLPDRPPAVEFAIDSLPIGVTKKPITESGRVLVVQRDFPLVLDGQNLGDDEEAAIALFVSRIKNDTVLYVAANPTVSWGRVRHALAVLPAALQVRLVVSSKPAKPAAEKEIGALITGLQKSAGTCSEVMNALADSASYAQAQRWHHLKRDMVSAVTKCDCEGVAVEALAGFVSKLGSDQLSYGWLPLSTFDFPANATMADVAKQLR